MNKTAKNTNTDQTRTTILPHNEPTRGNANASKSCGIVMPIAKMSDKYNDQHWAQVLVVVKEACEMAGFADARLVSDSESVNIIHKDIIQNLYTDDIIICDVSARNPNVFFELGMRLAFDKPVVIIKDYDTQFTFDIGGIRHLEYPFDLNYHSIKDFQQKLANQITATIKSYEDPNFTTFIKHFKDIKLIPTTLESKEVSVEQATLMDIQEQLNLLRRAIAESQNVVNKCIGLNYTAEDVKSMVRVLGDIFVRQLDDTEEKLILEGNNKLLDILFRKWLSLNYPQLEYRSISKDDILFLRKLIEDYQALV